VTDNSKRRGRGLVRWNGNTHPGLHEPLIDEDTFEKAQEIMRRRNEDSSLRRGNPTEFLLSGLAGSKQPCSPSSPPSTATGT
jgi:Recombinase